MYLYWKALKKDREYQRGYRREGCYPKPLMMVAIKFSTPIREVREILDMQKGEPR
jgi:hypothetical protein